MTSQNGLLVAINPGEDSAAVLDRAETLAGFLHCPVELFACEYDPYIAGERFFDDEELREARESRLTELRETLDEFAAPLRDRDVEVSTDVAWDHPGYEGIVRKVLETNPQLVVCGKQVHSGSGRAFFSNDDWNLIRTCPAPLMIADPGTSYRQGLRIWAAVDPFHRNDESGQLDDVIVRESLKLAKASRGTVHLVHTYSVSPLLSPPAPITPTIASADDQIQWIEQFHLAAVKKLAERHSIPDERIHNLPGAPKTVLPAVTGNGRVDLLIMGAVSRGFIGRIILGSSAEKVLDRLRCDLLIVKPESFVTPVASESDTGVGERCVA